MLSEDLTWNEHLKVLLSQVNKNFGVLRKLSYMLPSCIINKLYNSLILPYADYCNIVWTTHPSTLLEKLYRIQKKSVRILTSSDRKANAPYLFRQIGILKVYDVHKLHIACFVYKAMHCLLPPCFNDYFVLNPSSYCYNLRNNVNVKRYNSRTNVRFYCIKCYGPKIWNDIDSSVRNSPSIYVFTRRLKDLYLLNYV